MLRIGNSGNIFAKVIEAGEHARVIAFAGGGDGFIQCLAGDKAARHASGGPIGSNPIGETFAFGKREQVRPEHAETITPTQGEPNYRVASSTNFSAPMTH